jgi:hypothetical protein
MLIAWQVLIGWTVWQMVETERLVDLMRYEVQAVRQQQQANARTVEFLTDQYWELREQMRRHQK